MDTYIISNQLSEHGSFSGLQVCVGAAEIKNLDRSHPGSFKGGVTFISYKFCNFLRFHMTYITIYNIVKVMRVSGNLIIMYRK